MRQKIYFPNLNAIRFLAALLVVTHHTEQLKSIFGLPNHWNNPVVYIIGKLGVVLFFVLSGFLITYLLMAEMKVTGSVNIKNFYIRRILRIWPLYFVIVLSALFVWPFLGFLTMPGYERARTWTDIGPKLALFVFMLPNLVLNVFGVVPYASQAWSIGAEEQFYLVWPALIRTTKHTWLLLWGVIVAYVGVEVITPHVLAASPFRTTLLGFWESTPIDCMAIGGLYACMISSSGSVATAVRRVIFNYWLQWLVLAISVILVARAVYVPRLHYETYATLFGCLVCNLAANENRIANLEHEPLIYLGKISYGLYMYHGIAIVCVIQVCKMLGISSSLVVFPISVGATIVVASVSYEWFERRFIDRKVKFSAILTGDTARTLGTAETGK